MHTRTHASNPNPVAISSLDSPPLSHSHSRDSPLLSPCPRTHADDTSIHTRRGTAEEELTGVEVAWAAVTVDWAAVADLAAAEVVMEETEGEGTAVLSTSNKQT